MTEAAIEKWNKAAKCLEANQRGEETRYGTFKRHLFGKAVGRTMLVAAGTGVDFKYFPADVELTAIDFSFIRAAPSLVCQSPFLPHRRAHDLRCSDERIDEMRRPASHGVPSGRQRK